MTTTSSLTIDLHALVANWRTLSARAPRSQTAAVVKANAYGLGMIPVATALHKAGCRTFFVAHACEGYELRAALPDAVIYVLHGVQHADVKSFSTHRLRPVLNSAADIDLWASAIKSGMADPGAAVHVDTGMNRLGISATECATLAAAPPFEITHIISHFVESEKPQSAVTLQQVADFARLRQSFAHIPASLANSSGIFIDAAQYELNRPGYALYGGNPTPGQPNPMHPVVTLRAPILQIRNVPAGASVGYNGTFTTTRPTTLATLALGYADGWLRSGSNKTSAVVAGTRCPLVGNISMDLIIADVTAVPADRLPTTQNATLIGDGLPLDDVATSMGTIGYEILTRLGQRLPRHYING